MISSKRSSYSSSAAIVEGNEDLLIEILLFLPAKPLVKFKAVAKKWCSLISATSFCRRHTLHHRRRPLEKQHAFIFCNNQTTNHIRNLRVPGFIKVQFDLGFPEVEILQSCNGLLLLRCRRSSSGRNHYYVFNPTTSQPRDLSPLPFATVAGIYLMFDPSLSPHYRVVCFVHTKTCTLAYLYNSEIHERKLGGERLARKAIFHDGIYFNGGIYFLRFSLSSSRFTPDDGLVKIPPLPRFRTGRKGTYYTQSCKGGQNFAMESNGVLLFFSREDTNVLHVYATKEIESGWTNKYDVDMNPVLDGSGIGCINLLSMVLGEKEEGTLLLFTIPGKLMVYWFHGGVFEGVAEFDEYRREEGACSYQFAHHFIHSLAPA